MVQKRAGLVVFRQLDLGIEYLMLKPSKVGKNWSPPKGRIEDGEDTFSAALRETQEEVGYTVDDLVIYKDQQFSVEQEMNTRKGKTRTVTCFLARLKNTDKIPILSREHTEYRWVCKEQASSMCGIKGEFAPMFNEFESKISNNQLD